MNTEIFEDRSLLQNSAASKNYLDKSVYGIGAAGSFGIALYQGISIADHLFPEAGKWIALGTSVSAFGIALFGLIRAFKNDKSQKSDFVAVEVNKTSSSESQISQKINELAKLIHPDSETDSLTGDASQIFKQLNLIEEYLKSNNQDQKSLQLEKLLKKANKTLNEKNEEIQTLEFKLKYHNNQLLVLKQYLGEPNQTITNQTLEDARSTILSLTDTQNISGRSSASNSVTTTPYQTPQKVRKDTL